MKKHLLLFILVSGFLIFPVCAGERTIPVDIFLMVDKSLSMAEPGKYDSMQDWVKSHFLEQMTIPGDWIILYQFYGTPEHVLTVEMKTEAEKERIISAFMDIRPDGQYTDIGLALDTLQEALEPRKDNGRYKIMLLLTDLKQEAPWSSRYAGVSDSFDSPYLAQARTVAHDNWFEITLDMDIQDQVVKTSQELFAFLSENREERSKSGSAGSAGSGAESGSAGSAGSGSKQGEAGAADGGPEGRVREDQGAGTAETGGGTGDGKKSRGMPTGPLPYAAAAVLLSAAVVFFIVRRKPSDKTEEKQTITHS